MTTQQVLEAIPHGLLEKVAGFCVDTTKRKVTMIKDVDGSYRIEYQIAERVRRT